MNREIYYALIEAGASEEKASQAAASLSDYDQRFHDIEKNHDQRLNDMQQSNEQRFSRVESTQRLHSWMLTYLVGVVTALVLRSFGAL